MAAAAYKQFLAAPSTSLLADGASLHYVATLTSVSGASDIVKHLGTLQKQMRKKKQDVISVIDGTSTIAVEVDTGLEFLTSGGPYLPGLDDNFLTDRTAYLSIMHIVSFDGDGKIAQMRLYWDQGALLKQLEIIGKMGRNWPIRDSREQLAVIQSCLKSVGAGPAAQHHHDDVIIRTRGSSTNALRNPHASLQLFGSREELEAVEPVPVVSPYAGSRPRQRDFTEILGDEPAAGDAHRDGSISPSKAGQGKNYQPMRIFEGQEHHETDDEETPKTKTGAAYIRPNPRKYEHFDFVDESGPQGSGGNQPRPGSDERPKSKHDSQWSFDDFVTPHKPKPAKSFRHQEARHWDAQGGDGDGAEAQKPVGRARRDAETHFELQDDGEKVPRQERPGTKPRGAAHNEGLGLYKNNLFSQDDATPGPKRALGNITNLKDRTKDFDAHFAMTDESPAPEPPKPQHLPEGRLKAVKMMDANWAAYDQSPTAQKENQPRGADSRIHIAGDGMGGKKGTDRDWIYDGAGSESGDGIHIAGDGMGGKKGTNRDWLYGAPDGGEVEAPKPLASRRANAAAAKKSFWEF